jgi:hypothetical protein
MNIENEIENYDIECEMKQRDEMNDTNGDFHELNGVVRDDRRDDTGSKSATSEGPVLRTRPWTRTDRNREREQVPVTPGDPARHALALSLEIAHPHPVPSGEA